MASLWEGPAKRVSCAPMPALHGECVSTHRRIPPGIGLNASVRHSRNPEGGADCAECDSVVVVDLFSAVFQMEWCLLLPRKRNSKQISGWRYGVSCWVWLRPKNGVMTDPIDILEKLADITDRFAVHAPDKR